MRQTIYLRVVTDAPDQVEAYRKILDAMDDVPGEVYADVTDLFHMIPVNLKEGIRLPFDEDDDERSATERKEQA